MPRSYAYSAGLNWPDYLKVNEIRDVGEDVRKVQYEISSANKELIATNEQLTQIVSQEIQDATAQICSSPDGHFKIPHLWPPQNTPPRDSDFDHEGRIAT